MNGPLPLTPRPTGLRAMPPAASVVARQFRRAGLSLLTLGLAACQLPGPTPGGAGAVAAAPPASVAPEQATGWQAKPGWWFDHQAVAAANPLAAAAGAEMLRAGGSAVDAAVAVQMVLALVEPQSSGIGGGGFLLLWDGHALEAWDGRETAPAAATERLFLKPDGQPMAFADAVQGGRAVGVPGAVAMLEAVHRAHGRLPWARLFQPAIQLADAGFAISPRLYSLLLDSKVLKADPAARAYYYQPEVAGQALQPWPVGHVLRNPALAEVLRRIAQQGSRALLTGPVATSIVAKVRSHPGNPGLLTEADLAAYQPVQREALCADWRALRVCGMPPPSSGEIAIAQILTLLDALPPASGPALKDGRPTVETLHRYTEASNLAFADRALYVGDPAFVKPPAGRWASLLDPAYLHQRATLIGPRAMGSAAAGVPPGATVAYGPSAPQPEHGTSHISIVDAQGQAIAFTTTVESAFGTGLLVDGGTGLPGGFLLNNQLTDFNFAPDDAQGRPTANRVQPGKRPRSSMSPTLVFQRDNGQLLMTLGSPGGAAIIHYVTKLLLGTQVWGLDAQQAANLPNFGSFNGPTVLEAGQFNPDTPAGLKALGHEVREMELNSGAQLLERRDGRWFGAADPRREGAVEGD